MPDLDDRLGMGWLPDYPSVLDYTPDRDEVSARLERLGQSKPIAAMLAETNAAVPADEGLGASADLKQWFSPIENQGSIGSCTAQAAVGLVEYYERRAFGTHVEASRLFLYKASRNLLHWTGDTGAFIRTAMGAMVLFGVPPEEYWPYATADYDVEPPAFCYAFAQSFQAISYYRLDPPGTSPQTLLKRIKTLLDAGLPSMFGFTVYNSISQARSTGEIPYPTSADRVIGGHAVVAAGYKDSQRIKNSNPGGRTTTGAFLIRNSWGTGWGANGYGWLPYDYVLKKQAVDWWSLLKNEWIDTGKFGR